MSEYHPRRRTVEDSGWCRIICCVLYAAALFHDGAEMPWGNDSAIQGAVGNLGSCWILPPDASLARGRLHHSEGVWPAHRPTSTTPSASKFELERATGGGGGRGSGPVAPALTLSAVSPPGGHEVSIRPHPTPRMRRKHI